MKNQRMSEWKNGRRRESEKAKRRASDGVVACIGGIVEGVHALQSESRFPLAALSVRP